MEVYEIWALPGLRPGLELRVEAFEHDPGYGCGSGLKRDYELVDVRNSRIVASGVTCGCGKGCANYSCIRDDWGDSVTDIDEFRVRKGE